MMQECVVKNVKETNKLAKLFAKTLQGGEVILLSGDLGAGKTTFTKALFKTLGVKDAVTSPTFTLLREYDGKKLKLFHFDMYRIDNPEEVNEFGFSEYLGKKDSVVVIEWYEKIREVLKGEFVSIGIVKIDDNKRKFIFNREVTL